MAEVPIKVKHQGKVYDLEVDTSATGEILKMQIYSLTNVEPENQKVLAKKIIKDDTPLASLGFKAGTVITLIGNPSANVVTEVPKDKVKFAEDMTEAELAQLDGAIPAGLQNMGNTCYANATLQTLRAVPELLEELKSYKPGAATAGPASSLFSPQQLAQHGIGGLGGGNDLTAALGDLYKQMAETQQGFPPLLFLTTLRQKFPQFAEKAKSGHGYAQQDAEEVWSQLIQTLGTSLKLKDSEESGPAFKSWIDKYMGGKFEVTTKCDDAPEEEVTTNSEDFNDLKCNITSETNHLREGLSIALNETIEKNSPTLNAMANYTRTSRISRLPKYAPVHLIRFFWRKDTGKKAKILRRVTFQHEIDVLEFCTDELRKKIIPIRDKIREVRKEEEDVERAKKRQKRMRQDAEAAGDAPAAVRSDEPLQKKKEKEKEREAKAAGEPSSSANVKKPSGSEDVAMTGTTDAGTEVYKTDAEIDAERAASILALKKELLSLVHPDLARDHSANQTGLYELRGVVTHQGSSADSGHYTAYVKKTAAPGKVEDGKWWWFNDDKVQEVESEKIETLAGGGESHSALILLYRAVELPVIE
ncbi:cysteine proteinase [Dissoconium aciculare CBS 342.82]|uniref:Ubiquitin carboxyl-terminal hydrolase n=1 Tax=Dissoconium aciculare CBS 342.82 TaxID=1314786 RepID=A0A6J3MJ78_9PEZI|nr:cysteine proteinase [Dissoconium aciculare CBS 342.82]KAF1827966.1 cysteine proteinase [Dissoconium aciculare CBS 342.82]